MCSENEAHSVLVVQEFRCWQWRPNPALQRTRMKAPRRYAFDSFASGFMHLRRSAEWPEALDNSGALQSVDARPQRRSATNHCG